MPRPRSRVRYQLALDVRQPRLTSRTVPAVDPWVAGEMFVSAHVEERRRGLAILVGSDAARRSPLTPQLLSSRLDEPDLGLRADIVNALSDYFEIRGREYRYPADVRAAVAGQLRKFGRAQILNLLELHCAPHSGRAGLRLESLRRLMERLPAASHTLTGMAGDRGLHWEVRRAAIQVIGLVGFTDCLPPLEGLLLRLEGGRAGQLSMIFAPSLYADDQKLVPALKETLALLRDE